MMDEDDIVKSLFGMARSVSTGVAEDTWRRLEVQARLLWGGSRPYVSKKPTGLTRYALDAYQSSGTSLSDSCSVFGVTLRRGMQIRRRGG